MTDIHAAYVAAMTEIRNPSKDAKANAGSYGYTYLTYDSLSDYLRPILAKHGLAWAHDVANDDTHVHVRTLICHSSGGVLEFGPLSWPRPAKVQEFGGLLSYLKRYALVSTFGIGAGDDDDGAQANQTEAPVHVTGPRLTGPAGRNQARSAVEPASDKQMGMLKGLCRKAGTEFDVWIVSDKPAKILGHSPSDPLTKGEASALIEAITLYLNELKEVPDGGLEPGPGTES